MAQNSEKENLYEILKSVRIFNHLPKNVIEQLGRKMLITTYTKDEPVFRKGDIGDCIYFIVSGSVKLHEQEMIITEMSAGDFFGEFSLLDNEPRSLSVTTNSISRLATLSRNDFYLILKEHPESIKDIIEALIKRIREQNNKIFAFLKNREKELGEEVNEKTADLQKKNTDLLHTLDKLKQTQQQLVMKEILASLGQLTAGIAHTIKNPLNFVTNFSLVSLDLIADLFKSKDETEKKEILQNIKLNLEKIKTHGDRANKIIDNMLQHSVSGTGDKQIVNINELISEVSSIAFYNYQSNYPGFSCEIKREFSNNIPELNVSTKEISRVLLNLLTNAFDAMKDKKKSKVSSFKPLLNISTSYTGKQVKISIKDNGTGVPIEIRDRIFEPFFTTKPTWQGNGLGLSMSNEIINMHGGELKFNDAIDDGAEFLIMLTA